MDNSLTNSNSHPPDREALIHAVIDAVHAGTFSFRQARKQYSIPHTTISNHFHGRKPPSFAHKCQKLLTNVQKMVVIEWCRWCGDMADLMTRAKLDALMYDLTQWTASENWMHRFLKRNVGQITANRAHGLDTKHAQAFNWLIVEG